MRTRLAGTVMLSTVVFFALTLRMMAPNTTASKQALLALSPRLVHRVSRSPGAIELGFCSHHASGRQVLSRCFEKPTVMQDL
jgi:hypothetical protein